MGRASDFGPRGWVFKPTSCPGNDLGQVTLAAGESDSSSYGYHYHKHLPISNRLTFIAPDLRSALCKQMGSIVLVDWIKHRLDC